MLLLFCCPSAGRSNALNIAARLGLDSHIVAAARQRLAAGVAAANEAIQELEVAQEELKQADLAAFAVEADVNVTKVGHLWCVLAQPPGFAVGSGYN